MLSSDSFYYSQNALPFFSDKHRHCPAPITNIACVMNPRINGVEHQFPWAGCPFYLILSNQLEGRWVGKIEDSAELPSELRIDWIKVYEKL